MPNATTETATRRYNLVLPERLFNDLQQAANEQDTTVVELMRRFIKLGLLALKLQDAPDAGLIVRQGDDEHKVMLF